MGGGACIFNRRGNGSLTLTLHREYYQRKFISENVCSWAFLFNVFILLTLIILPFVLTFSTGTFWVKQEYYTEQPLVTFTHKLYGELIFTSNNDFTKTYTFSSLKNLRDDNQVTPIITSSHQDLDRDGIPERWNISMRVRKPLPQNQMQSGTIVMAFQYETQKTIKMQMETLAVVEIQNQGGKVKKIKTVGQLELKQRSAIINSRNTRSLYNDDLFNYLQQETLQDFLGTRYFNGQRNESTLYTYETFTQQGDDPYIDLTFIVNIPREQQILYAPDVWEVLKFAWIQYYSLLVLVYVFLYHFFYGFVIKNKVFDSVEISQINIRAFVQEKKKCL